MFFLLFYSLGDEAMKICLDQIGMG